MSREIIFQDLTLQNFKCHEELSFSFTPNRFVTLTGNNGKGKTSIFSALVWALYDECLDGTKADEVVRKRSGKNTFVSISWSIDSDNYLVEAYRKHSKHKNKRYLYKNGSDITCENNSETLALIEQILMPKDIFMNCLLFSQYVKNHFADMTYSGQREIFDKMLSLLVYDEYYKKCSAYSKNIEEEFRTLDEEVKINSGYANTYIKIIEDEERKIQDRKKEILETIESIEDAIIKSKNRVVSFKEEMDNIGDVESLFKDYTDKVSKLENEIDIQRERCLSELELLIKSIEYECSDLLNSTNNGFIEKTILLKEELNRLEISLTELSQKRFEADTNLKQKEREELDKFNKERDEILNPIKDRLNIVENELKILIDRLETLQRLIIPEKNEYEKFISFLKQDIPKCATCEQDIIDQQKVNVVKNKVNNLKKSVDEKELSLIELKKSIEKLQNEKQSLTETLYTKIKEFEPGENIIIEKVDRSKKHIEKVYLEQKTPIDGTIQKLKSEIEELEITKEKKMNSIKEIYNNRKIKDSNEIKEKYKNMASTSIQNLEKLKEKGKKIIEQREQKSSIDEKMKKVEEEIKIEENRVSFIKQTYDENTRDKQKQIDHYRELIKESNQKSLSLSERRNYLEEKIRIINFWKIAFSDSGIKSILLDETIPILNKRAIELCSLVPQLKINFDSQTELKSGEYRNKFNIGVLQTRNLSSHKELSSGEKRMVDIIIMLCLRYLLEMIQESRLNILLLDEILDSLDPENSAIAGEIVKKLSQDHCVVLISHTLRNYIESDESFVLA